MTRDGGITRRAAGVVGPCEGCGAVRFRRGATVGSVRSARADGIRPYKYGGITWRGTNPRPTGEQRELRGPPGSSAPAMGAVSLNRKMLCGSEVRFRTASAVIHTLWATQNPSIPTPPVNGGGMPLVLSRGAVKDRCVGGSAPSVTLTIREPAEFPRFFNCVYILS